MTLTADQIHRDTYGKVFTCSRCRSRVDGIHNDDHEAVLETLGWHKVGDVRLCCRGCLEWHQALAARGDAPTAVTELPDRAYQARRAAMNLPNAAPPLAHPPPVKR